MDNVRLLLPDAAMRLLPCVVLLAGPVLAQPAVLFQPTVGTPTRVTLSGRVLKSAPSRSSSVVGQNVRRLTSSNWEGALVEVAFGGQSTTVTSGHDGDFQATLEAPAAAPFEVGLSAASAHVRGATASALVDVLAPAAPFVVVSDFDDTVAVTNVVDPRGLLTAALGQDELTQPVVPGMAGFYQCLRSGHAARPAFMLVSGSPLQYLDRVRAFLLRHGFPPFGIALRNLGPASLRDYKQPVIRALLKALPNPVVLVGDSGEHDPEVYRQIRDEFPGRVAAIYIRNAGRAETPKRFAGMLLFDEPAQALADAVSRGLAQADCTLEKP